MVYTYFDYTVFPYLFIACFVLELLWNIRRIAAKQMLHSNNNYCSDEYFTCLTSCAKCDTFNAFRVVDWTYELLLSVAFLRWMFNKQISRNWINLFWKRRLTHDEQLSKVTSDMKSMNIESHKLKFDGYVFQRFQINEMGQGK